MLQLVWAQSIIDLYRTCRIKPWQAAEGKGSVLSTESSCSHLRPPLAPLSLRHPAKLLQQVLRLPGHHDVTAHQFMAAPLRFWQAAGRSCSAGVLAPPGLGAPKELPLLLPLWGHLRWGGARGVGILQDIPARRS